MNISPAAATDEPAVPSTPSRAPRPGTCAARVSDRLAPDLIDPALSAGRDVRPGRAQRRDGWKPERIRTFLNALAECGVVEDAARAAGMSKQSAYNLRNRASGRAFHVAWDAAEQLGRRRLAGAVMSRAMHGCVEVIMRNGEVWGERHRFDNRLTMAVLARLDRAAEGRDDENRVARLVAEEFDQFLDIVCDRGGEGAAEFVADRIEADRWTPAREARTLERCGNYERYGVGLPEEIDVDDLDPDERKSWTREQRERALRAGLVEEDELEDEGEDEGKDGVAEKSDLAEKGDIEEEGVEGVEDQDDEDDDDDDDDDDYEEDDDDDYDDEDDDEGDRIGAIAAEAVWKTAEVLIARKAAAAAGNSSDPVPSAPPAEAPAEPAFAHHSGWVAAG